MTDETLVTILMVTLIIAFLLSILIAIEKEKR